MPLPTPLLRPPTIFPCLQTLAPSSPKQRLLLPPKAIRIYPQSRMLGSGAPRPLPLQTSGSTQVRVFFIRPGDYELGPASPRSQIPRWFALVLSSGEHGREAYTIGGWDPSSWEPVRDVFLYEFTTQRWTQCADMPSIRSFFAVGAVEGKVLVAGGHDESKNALNSAWILDIKEEWWELGRMREERDECEGVVVGRSSGW
ncbi:UNVERIFIED_CONTAM: F-box/kelch-repeat protein [Sesamum radiatum]|uniref:F-box/kelch-repeat protein n=1 Tax=Sesamum radiatum TaxID=300843 RepID=A0AAW2TJX3_SESRA